MEERRGHGLRRSQAYPVLAPPPDPPATAAPVVVSLADPGFGGACFAAAAIAAAPGADCRNYNCRCN
eukprot:10323060-Lingulodinium_polyedra.AAC.1